MNKKNLVALFGGQSSEHVGFLHVRSERGCQYRQGFIYNVYLVGITEEGRWLLVDSEKEIKEDTWRTGKKTAVSFA